MLAFFDERSLSFDIKTLAERALIHSALCYRSSVLALVQSFLLFLHFLKHLLYILLIGFLFFAKLGRSEVNRLVCKPSIIEDFICSKEGLIILDAIWKGCEKSLVIFFLTRMAHLRDNWKIKVPHLIFISYLAWIALLLFFSLYLHIN